MKLDRERFKRCKEQHQLYPIRYSAETVHALANFFELLDALKAVQEERPRMNPGVWAMVNKAVANAENPRD